MFKLPENPYKDATKIYGFELRSPTSVAYDVFRQGGEAYTKALIEWLEQQGYWGQVPHEDLEKGRTEKTMWCIPDDKWQELKEGL